MVKCSGDGKSPTFPFTTRYTQAIDGEMAYFDHGDGPAVVFVHGLVGDFSHFEHVAVRLAAHGHRVIGVDLPGCGSSHKRRGSHDIGGYARDVLTLLDHLGLERASLVGHSAGGAVVAEAALRAPNRVSRLGLLSSAGLRRFPKPMRVAARAVVRPWLLERTLERLAMPLLDLVFVERNAYTEKFVRDALDRPVYPTNMEMARVMSDLVPELVTASVLDRAQHFAMPVLAIWGETDKLVPPESARILRDKLKNGVLRVLPRCGHMPMIERPEQTARELAAFLAPELAEVKPVSSRRAA
ncbi:MAG: alpha/beta fold hydrolase [Polyangiaceae bacterium]